MLPLWQHRGLLSVAGICSLIMFSTIGTLQQTCWSLCSICVSPDKLSQPERKDGPVPVKWRGKELQECSPHALEAFRQDSSFPVEKLCEATPWLLPARTKALSYAGVTEEKELLAMRAKPFGRHNKTLSIFFFNRAYAEMTQNYVYTLVRFAGVTNYVAATWHPEDYAACRNLNLPCWDVSRFLPGAEQGGGGRAGPQELLFGQAGFYDMGWTRTVVAAYLVERDYVLHLSDVDISYSAKPLWDSYLRFIEDGGADMAGAAEGWGINTGNYVVLNSPAGKAFMRAWADARTRHGDTTEQWGLDELHKDSGGSSHATCVGIPSCRTVSKELAAKGLQGRTALIRMYPIPHTVYHPHGCWMAEQGALETMPIDPCHWTMAFLHPICQTGAANKTATIKAAGFWFMGDCAPPRKSTLARCTPQRWSQPRAEDHFWRCSEHPLAFTYVPREQGQARPRQVAR